MSGPGSSASPRSGCGAAPTRYGGIVDSTDEFRSRHIQAVSVSVRQRRPVPVRGAHSAGQPDHGDGTIVRRDPRRRGAGDLDAVRVTRAERRRADGRRWDRRRVVRVRDLGVGGPDRPGEKHPPASNDNPRTRDCQAMAGTGPAGAPPRAPTPPPSRDGSPVERVTSCSPAMRLLTWAAANASSRSAVVSSWTTCAVTARSRSSASPTRVCVGAAGLRLRRHVGRHRSSIDAPTSSSRIGRPEPLHIVRRRCPSRGTATRRPRAGRPAAGRDGDAPAPCPKLSSTATHTGPVRHDARLGPVGPQPRRQQILVLPGRRRASAATRSATAPGTTRSGRAPRVVERVRERRRRAAFRSSSPAAATSATTPAATPPVVETGRHAAPTTRAAADPVAVLELRRARAAGEPASATSQPVRRRHQQQSAAAPARPSSAPAPPRSSQASPSTPRPPPPATPSTRRRPPSPAASTGNRPPAARSPPARSPRAPGSRPRCFAQIRAGRCTSLHTRRSFPVCSTSCGSPNRSRLMDPPQTQAPAAATTFPSCRGIVRIVVSHTNRPVRVDLEHPGRRQPLPPPQRPP